MFALRWSCVGHTSHFDKRTMEKNNISQTSVALARQWTLHRKGLLLLLQKSRPGYLFAAAAAVGFRPSLLNRPRKRRRGKASTQNNHMFHGRNSKRIRKTTEVGKRENCQKKALWPVTKHQKGRGERREKKSSVPLCSSWCHHGGGRGANRGCQD